MAVTAPKWILAQVNDLEIWVGDAMNTYVDQFQQLISHISAYMERYTDRKLAARDYDYTIAGDKVDAIGDGDGTATFFTKQYPINSIATLKIGDNTITENTAWNADDGYILYPSQGKIYYSRGFDAYRENIQLEYNAGYGVDTQDYTELNLICCHLVKFIWDNKGRLGLKQEFLGRYRYTKGDFKSTDRWLYRALDSYKRSVIK
jgi:hypothetical protein